MSESIFPLSGKGIPKELTLCLLCTFLQKNEQITLLSTCKEGQQELRKTRLLSIDPIVQMKTISMTCDELMEKFLQLVGREKGRLCLWNKIHNLETHPQVLYLLQHGYISSIFLSSLQQPLVDLLQHVSEVRLLNCPEVHDLTSLQGKTEKLHLQNMPNIRNISMLRQVRELSLKHMKQKLDIRSLYNLEKLSLINSHHVEGLTHLPRLQELSLINETQQYIRTNSNVDNGHYDLNIIFMLAHLRSLSLDGLRSLEHLPSLPKTLQKIQINFCNQLHDIAAVAHVPNIHITCCSKIVDVSVLANIKRLPLDNCCSDLHRRSVYHQLSEVYISRTSLTDVSPLAGVHKLTLFDCPLVSTISLYIH